MHYELRQSTAGQEIEIGPFLDETDGITPLTALTISAEDIRIWKHGATDEVAKNSGGATHIAGGRYYMVLDATDSNTPGNIRINVHPDGSLPCAASGVIRPTAIHDALVLGTGILPVNTTQISGDLDAADALEAVFDGTAGPVHLFGILDRGVAQAASSTTLTLRSAAAFADDALIGCTIVQIGGTNAPQAARITDNVGSTDVVTVDAWPNGTPSGSITYQIYATTPDAGGGGGLDAAGVRAALGMASANLDTQLSTIDTVVGRIEADTQDLQTQVGTDGAGLTALPWNAAWDAEVQSECADALNAYDPPTKAEMDARTLASADYATASALGTVDSNVDSILEDTGTTLPSTLGAIAGYVDTEVAAIKAVTDKVDTTLEADDSDWKFTAAALAETPVGEGGGGGPSAGQIADAVLDEALAGHTTSGTLGKAMADVLEDTGTTLPAALATILGHVDTIPADVLAAVTASGLTISQSMALLGSVFSGKFTTTEDTITFRDVADTKNLLVVTYTGDNRTGVVLNWS